MEQSSTSISENTSISFAGINLEETIETRMKTNKLTGYVFDERMAKHKNPFCDDFVECPDRIVQAHQRCRDLGLLDRCEILEACEIEQDQAGLIHDESYLQFLKSTSTMKKSNIKQHCSNYDSVFINESTALASRLAAGSLLCLTEKVYQGRLRNGLALIRPPGHHAMRNEPCGYCLMNNVAIAAKYSIKKLKAKKVVILDLDVHHGQGIQYEFYDNPNVFYISIHAYMNQTFWPSLRESNYDFIGEKAGLGYNCNIPLNEFGMSNSDYLAIFHSVVLPLINEFNPQLILVSCGFDFILGCPLGKMTVHPSCVAHLLHKLMMFAQGKVVVALEGGYCVDSLSESVVHVLKTLLGDPCPSLEKLSEMKQSTKDTVLNTIQYLRPFWKSLSIQGVSEYVLFPDISDLQTQTWRAEDKDIGLPNKNEPIDECIPDYLIKLKEIMSATVFPNYPNQTCIVYDESMGRHRHPSDNCHPEVPERIHRIYNYLEEYGLLARCKILPSRDATREELLLVHDSKHVDLMESLSDMSDDDRNEFADAHNSIYVNEHTYTCALRSAGCLLNVVDEVCQRKSRNGAAVVRPPGHHAESHCCKGFCFFNNVALAARYAQRKHGYKRVLIVDWDVHHGNGVQEIFDNDSSVLYISIHRFDNGRFYPGTNYASPESKGSGIGEGFSVNIGWNKRPIGDTDYLSAFFNVVLPLSHEFNPDLVMVSSGFDAAKGDPLGGLGVSAECFGQMTWLLSNLAEGRLILALEGGYNLRMISEAMAHCVASLLGDPCARPARIKQLTKQGIKALNETCDVHSSYWKSLNFTDSLPMHVKELPKPEDLQPQFTNEESFDNLLKDFAQITVSSNDTENQTLGDHIHQSTISPV